MIVNYFATFSARQRLPHKMRPGNYWPYLFLCAVAVAAAYAEVRPIGLQVSGVFQQLVDAFQGNSGTEVTQTTSSGGDYDNGALGR